MQFDHQRAFPYPVLRPDVDDYTDGDFQTAVDIRPVESDLAILAHFQCALSVPEIMHQIEIGNASFAIVVSCRETYHREVIFHTENSTERRFSGGSLRGEVQINPYVICRKKVVSFSCALINEEFGKGPFEFPVGSILAVDEPKVVYIDRDVFKPITSIFEMVIDPNLNGPEWRLRFDQPKVAITLSALTKERIDIGRSATKNKAILINSLYFSAVMQCVGLLRAGAEYDEWRWAVIMRQQCHNLGIDLSADEYLISEQLMKYPLGLLSAYVFGETGE
jgi:hypothetical protein